jgi:LmbE family N-acetylglucosaminyl deacetylase
MKALFIHAHYDDFEFTAAGTFELWRRRLGADFQGRVLICTDGASGHHFRTRAETARLRLKEQKASAAIGGYEFELLRLPDRRVPREACLVVGPPLLAALWKSIRDFEPDYVFGPPLPADPLVGLHLDHQAVAEAIRQVAYLINVPHVFTPEYPAEERHSRPCRVPVILTVFDGYLAGASAYDFAVNTEAVFDPVCAMTWCHQSQIREWLPWVGRHNLAAPESLAEWSRTLRARFAQQQRAMGLPAHPVVEVFTVTGWGDVPTADRLRRDFPNVQTRGTRWNRLCRRLRTWRGESR